jgi:hypothetical protein
MRTGGTGVANGRLPTPRARRAASRKSGHPKVMHCTPRPASTFPKRRRVSGRRAASRTHKRTNCPTGSEPCLHSTRRAGRARQTTRCSGPQARPRRVQHAPAAASRFPHPLRARSPAANDHADGVPCGDAPWTATCTVPPCRGRASLRAACPRPGHDGRAGTLRPRDRPHGPGRRHGSRAGHPRQLLLPCRRVSFRVSAASNSQRAGLIRPMRRRCEQRAAR